VEEDEAAREACSGQILLYLAAKVVPAGESPDEQAEMLRSLATQEPLWKKLPKARAKRPRKTVRTPGKRRSTG
jgi:hypothetical protein